MFQKILFPTDGSLSSLQAADVIGRLAGPQGELSVTVAVGVSPLSADESDYRTEYLQSHNDWLRQEAQRVADRAVHKLKGPGLNVTTKILEGKPVSALLSREAVSGHYDLIVMGSRGLGQQDNSLRYLGSVTEHVLRRVAIPVMVVPVQDDETDD